MFNKLTNTFRYLCASIYLGFSNLAFAAGDADDIFEPLNDKTTELVEQVTTWASIICILMIVVFGVMTMMGKLSKFWGACIIGGSIIVLVASGLADFLLS